MGKLISKIKNSLSTKIFLGVMSILIIACLLIFGSLRILMPRTFENEQSTEFLANLDTLTKELEDTPVADIESYITSFAVKNRASITVTDDNGNTVSSVNMAEQTDNSITKTDQMTGVAEFQNAGRTYTIQAAIEGDSADQISRTFTKVFPYIIILILIISVLAAFFYSGILAKPIVNISSISKKMTALDMTWRCDIKRSDEIGVLADSLNEMAESLDKALRELKTANIKLQADIDWERLQEKRRRDFFAAISHELKTPVAVLKGELEGMICNVGKFKDRDTYLQEAFETAESIEKLVKEIMSLAKMNMEEMKLDIEETDISKLTEDCLKPYEHLASGKQISIREDIEADVFCRADYKNMKNVLSNIIGNAVNHSPEKAAINVAVKKSGSTGILSVENSGVHIDIEEIGRIFEPFYRVDKSRSRHTGGSGLGLYIVKTILDMHGFDYGMENTETGIQFKITFPIL